VPFGFRRAAAFVGRGRTTGCALRGGVCLLRLFALAPLFLCELACPFGVRLLAFSRPSAPYL
jgi:hypothetical protein